MIESLSSNNLASSVTLLRRSAAEQGGVLSGSNPTVFNLNDPYQLWAIQVFLITVVSRLCFILFYKMKQPRVVAEILGGIVLGPTCMGRIPGFTETIFPTESIPLLQLCATIGLIFLLFLAALEIDFNQLKPHLKTSSIISAAGLLFPLGFGALLAKILYPQFADPSIDFRFFLLFCMVSISITAFPILCRMLVELNLFESRLGVVVISAGVGNDIVGWVLLALAVSLTNAKSGLTALWILLACLGYTIFSWYPVRLAYRWLAFRTGSLESGHPSPTMITLTILLVLINAFFTDIIGLHAIFGAFLSGLMIPHENGFARNLLIRMEDLVMNIFLPIYFALSGLKTDLGLLNTGKAWGFTVLVCVFAYCGKFIGCGLAAKTLGFSVRQSCAIGTLMTCKGLLELIAINLALQANVFTTQVFAMFVVHAMILTISITPLTALVYPEKLRQLESTQNSVTLEPISDVVEEDEDRKSEHQV